MKVAPYKAEQRTHVVILQQNIADPKRRRLRNNMLAELRPDDFGTKEGIEIRERMDVLIRGNQDLGDVSSFLDDPTLSDEAREFLNVSAKYRRKASTVPKRQALRLVSMLHDYRKSRALYAAAQEITELCTKKYTEETFPLAENALLNAVKAIREDRNKKVTSIGRTRDETGARRWFKQMLKPREDQFVSTGLPALDKHMQGYQRGDLVVVSAPRGGGKTALLLQSAINQFRAGYSVGIASLEMKEEHLWERVIANVTDTEFWKIRGREYDLEDIRPLWNKWLAFEIETSQRYNNVFAPWDIKDPDYMPENIELDLGPMGYDVIYVDYISLFGTGKKEMWRAQKDHGRYLKILAGRLNCVIIVLTQLSKDERVKYGSGPEEDADYWLWWRYGDDEVKNNIVELRLDKARHAKRCIMPAEFKLAQMQIETKGTAELSMSKFAGKSGKGGEQESDANKTGPSWDPDEFGDEGDLDRMRDLEPTSQKEAPVSGGKKSRKSAPARQAKGASATASELEDELDDLDQP